MWELFLALAGVTQNVAIWGELVSRRDAKARQRFGEAVRSWWFPQRGTAERVSRLVATAAQRVRVENLAF
ncbi:hypothetical protein IQ243_04830 [Nostocales cyanobacterium LEGE 11386]|nr:hypothetical protein [Nostocales cyanobacterium LEGE 11386]